MTTTKEANIAYSAIAAQNIGVKLDDIMLLVDEMAYLMDIYTESEIIDKAHKLIGREDR